MKAFLEGIAYNFKGLKMAMQTPFLLVLGLVRFAVLVMISVLAVVLILDKYQAILNLMWPMPVDSWLVWVWHPLSWVLALLLMGFAAVIGFLIAQILFSVIIMDWMSQITERRRTGVMKTAPDLPALSYFIYLLRQEIPRAVLPVLASLLLLVLSWFTPLGPILTIVSPLLVGVFLAWDNTDLVPARRLNAFSARLRFLRTHLGFHLGFGVLLLVPVLNLLLLSYAPVGATLWYLEHADSPQ